MYPGRPPDHRRCRAKASRSGERCWRWSIRGARVCATHGGSAPQVRRKARQREALRKGLHLTHEWYEREAERYRRLEEGE
jgi:hypothetical protein